MSETYFDAFGREKAYAKLPEDTTPPRQHEHIFHTAKDAPPEPAQWVIEGWLKQHTDDGFEGPHRVHEPVWVEQSDENGHISEGYWVIVTEAGG